MGEAACLGEEHPDTLRKHGNLASHTEPGRMEGAEALQVVWMDKSKHALGEEHPGTLKAGQSWHPNTGNQGRWKREALEVVVMEKASMPWRGAS